MSNSRIKETSFENCKVVTCGFSQELHDKVVEMVRDNPFWLADYDLEEVDQEMVNVWMADAYSEGDEDYVNFLRNTIIDDGTLYTLTERVGGFKQPLGEVAVYINEEGYAEKLRQDAENVIYDMFSDWDISDAGELCCNIIDEVCEDVIETSDYPEYNDSDIRIAVKRTIIKLTSIGK
jgi:hypothetical protein